MSLFSEMLARFVDSKSIKIYQLANLCGIERSWLQKMLTGKRKPADQEQVMNLSQALALTYTETQQLMNAYRILEMGEENWLICDIGRKKAVIHERRRKWLLAELSSDEMERLQREGTEENWAKLWKTFFTAIAIEERKNPNCQRNHLPLRFRDLMTEFQ